MSDMKEVYEKHKHLDKLLSDKEWLPDSLQARMLYEFWQAIKAWNTRTPDHKEPDKCPKGG